MVQALLVDAREQREAERRALSETLRSSNDR